MCIQFGNIKVTIGMQIGASGEVYRSASSGHTVTDECAQPVAHIRGNNAVGGDASDSIVACVFINKKLGRSIVYLSSYHNQKDRSAP